MKELVNKNKELEKEIKSLCYNKDSIERELRVKHMNAFFILKFFIKTKIASAYHISFAFCFKHKSESIQLLERELDRFKESYSEAVKTVCYSLFNIVILTDIFNQKIRFFLFNFIFF